MELEHAAVPWQPWSRVRRARPGGLDPDAVAWRLDVFRAPPAGDTWICRRDPSIRLPHAELVERTPGGIPFVRPEVVLLFKAKCARERTRRTSTTPCCRDSKQRGGPG